MKYYITADIHGFYTEFHKALDEAGYFNDSEPRKLIILGDIFDRGQEAVEMQRFILSLLEQCAHRGRFYVRTGHVHGGRLYVFSPSALRRPLRRVSH